MNIYKLNWRNIASKPWPSFLSVLLLALGVGMISLLLQVNDRLEAQLNRNIRGIDMVVGAKGSPLHLILSSVYHIDAPTGNIPLAEVDALLKNRLIEQGIPLAYGDNYLGYRIVGTTHEYIKHYAASLAEGRLYGQPFEATVGASVANKLELKIGDTFFSAHGLDEEGALHEENRYNITGILAYSGSVIDQLILTPLETVWRSHRHEGEGKHEDEHEDEKTRELEDEMDKDHDHENENDHDLQEEGREITALLVKFRSPLGIIQLPRMVNENTSMQAAVPAYEMGRLLGLMEFGIKTLKAIALAIMLVSGISVFISMYNALEGRKYEMALMRSLGASRNKLLRLVIQEGLILSLLGFIVGFILSRAGMFIITMLVQKNFRYGLSGFPVLEGEIYLLIVTLAIGFSASIIPAYQVFNINISKSLSDA